jgi:hypothetical protein
VFASVGAGAHRAGLFWQNMTYAAGPAMLRAFEPALA